MLRPCKISEHLADRSINFYALLDNGHQKIETGGLNLKVLNKGKKQKIQELDYDKGFVFTISSKHWMISCLVTGIGLLSK